RTRATDNRHRSVSLSRGRNSGKRRHFHQHTETPAVSKEGRRATRGRTQRDMVHVSPGAATEGKSKEGYASAECWVERAYVELFTTGRRRVLMASLGVNARN